MNFVFAPAPRTYLPIVGSSSVFPVHRIYCVGRNYAAHAVEMGGDPTREEPFFFQKNPDSLLLPGREFPYPPKSDDVHHEVELVLALTRGGENIPLAEAEACIGFYAVGLDMTRRDLQAECKKHGRPWEIAKAFEHSAPCSALVPAAEIGHPKAGAIWLEVNGERPQAGDLNQMIWKPAEIVSYLSGYFALQPGDLIMTGTPSGVGPVRRGDRLHGHIDRVGDLGVTIV
jgi:fumarylpyruvate hydrolase